MSYHHGDLRAVLLDRAEQILREGGVAELSLRALARDTGVSHAAPSRHFKDRQALLDALALTGFERLTEILEQVDATVDGTRERFTALGRSYVDFAIGNSRLLELMYARKHDPDVSEQVSTAVGRMVAAMLRPIVDGQAAGDIVAGEPERIALVVAASLHGIATFACSGAFSAEETIEFVGELVHHMLHGLTPR
jgi:AcrR family transcriptional regulator